MARRGENIYKRKDGRWEGRYIKGRDSNNKAIYGYIYGSTYRDVKKNLQIKKNTVLETDTISNNFVLFSIVANEWLKSMAPKFKESTKIKYHNLLKMYILPKLGEISIQEITTVQIDQFCNELLASGGKNGSGLSTKTVTDVLCLIKSIIRYAISEGICSSCDISTIKIKPSPKEMRVLTLGEQQQLCDYLLNNPDIQNVGILLCLFTGIRIGEVCALSWDDISFKENTIFIHQTMQRIQTTNDEAKTKIIITTPKSQCSIRTIPIPESIASILKNVGVEKKGYFLSGSVSKYIEPRTMQNHFKTVLQKADIKKANFHSLRHTFATRCVELGFDIKSLSVILGHSSVNITMNRYVHPSMELKRKNMQRLSDLFNVK